MYYLILYILANTGPTSLVIPDKYATLDECKEAGITWTDQGKFICMKAPKALTSNYEAYYNCMTSIPTTGMIGSYQIAKTHCDLPVGAK